MSVHQASIDPLVCPSKQASSPTHFPSRGCISKSETNGNMISSIMDTRATSNDAFYSDASEDDEEEEEARQRWSIFHPARDSFLARVTRASSCSSSLMKTLRTYVALNHRGDTKSVENWKLSHWQKICFFYFLFVDEEHTKFFSLSLSLWNINFHRGKWPPFGGTRARLL